MILTLIKKLDERTKDKRIQGLFLCKCGNEKTLPISRVNDGSIISCGCYAKEKARDLRTTHGMRNSKEYSTWNAMKERCLNKNSKDYKRYGSSGITICNEWVNSFETFFKDMGKRPPGTSIDRINNDIGYSKENCRWASNEMQQKNKSNSFFVVIEDKTYESLTDAANAYGVTKQTISKWVYGWTDKRINKKWSAKNGCRIIQKY